MVVVTTQRRQSEVGLEAPMQARDGKTDLPVARGWPILQTTLRLGRCLAETD